MEDVIERERRFVVTGESILDGSTGNLVEQAYFSFADGYVVGARRTHITDGAGVANDSLAVLTTKGSCQEALRGQYEMEIPVHFAAALIARSELVVRKLTHRFVSEHRIWDVDVFLDENQGLILAEYEARNVRLVHAPWWCGEEVSADQRYDNEALATRPFRSWKA
jgi:CYTH domain-containing protein